MTNMKARLLGILMLIISVCIYYYFIKEHDLNLLDAFELGTTSMAILWQIFVIIFVIIPFFAGIILFFKKYK